MGDFRSLDSSPLALAAAVRAQFTKYVAFHSDVYDVEADTLTLWVMHTHAFAAAETTPYLAVIAPTEKAGKSRIIDVARHLVPKPDVVVDPSPASLFRFIDAVRPTLFIDEVDMLYESKALKSVLNAGDSEGGCVRRAGKNKDGEFVSLSFTVYCPKMFAGIAGRRLPVTGATLSRCIQIPMRQKTDDEVVAKFSRRRARIDCDPIRSELMQWAELAVPALEEAEPSVPSVLDGRQEEGWEPLLAIADHLGGDWPERARLAATVLSERLVEEPTEGLQILHDVNQVWSQHEGDRIHTGVLAARCNDLDNKMYVGHLSAQDLSLWLTRRFEVHPLPNPFRLGGSKPKRGYSRSAFEDVFHRYLS